MPVYRTTSERDTLALGCALGQMLKAGDTLLLTGDLGAGKSVLARGIARGLGITCAMPSPTFTLMQPYEGRCPLYHFDLYRLEDVDEFYESGLDEYVGGQGVAVIEWPDRMDMALPERVEIDIRRGQRDDDRQITIDLPGMDARAQEIASALDNWRISL